jgi:hypothetical protein
MRKPAVPAPDGKVPAPYGHIMGTCHVAVPAFNGLCKVPDIITSDFVKCPWPGDILNSGDKNTRRPAVVTHHLCLIRYCCYDLVCHLLAMVAVSAEFCKNEPVTHGKYWMCPGSLICCRIYFRPKRSLIRKKRDRTADCHVLQSGGVDHIIGNEQEKYARIGTEIILTVPCSSISNFKRFFGIHRAK